MERQTTGQGTDRGRRRGGARTSRAGAAAPVHGAVGPPPAVVVSVGLVLAILSAGLAATVSLAARISTAEAPRAVDAAATGVHRASGAAPGKQPPKGLTLSPERPKS